MSSNNPILPSTPKDHGAYYFSGSNDPDAVYGPKKGYSVLGEFFDRGLHQQAEKTSYYENIVKKRYQFAGEYLDNSQKKMDGETFNSTMASAKKDIKEASESTKNSSNYVGEATQKSAENIIESTKTIKETCDFVTKTMGEILELVKNINQADQKEKEKEENSPTGKKKNIKARLAKDQTEEATEEAPQEEEKEEEKDTTSKALGQFKASWETEQGHMRTGEAVLAIVMEQVLDVAKKIEEQVRQGRKEAAETYNSNASEVLSRGVTDKTSYMLETASISNELLKNDLYANLSTNEIYKGYTELVKKGYSDEDATEMAMEDAIEAKIAPYLDTTSTAFKDLQNKFGDQFLNKISGINNYIQEIAGSAKVWETNANTIISSLEPIQLWAEQQNWGEDEMAALEYLVEEGGMTQTEASQLIQEALKVSTDQYGSITGGTIAQKVAVATGQTDFGSAISSLLGTSNIVSNSNQLVQGAGLTALGVRGFTAENADLETRWDTYQAGYSKAKASTSTAEDKTSQNLLSLMNGNLTTTKEAETNISENTGSIFAFMEEMFPTTTEKLDAMLGVETVISGITSIIAIRQGRQLAGNAISSITGGSSSGGGILSSILGGTSSGGSGSIISRVLGGASSEGSSGILSKIFGAGAGTLGTIGAVGITLGTAALATYGIIKLAQYAADKSNEKSKIKVASLDVGSDYIANDQLAYIHKGEAVLTPEENKEYQKNKKATSKLATGNIQVQVEQEEKNDKLIYEVKQLKNEILDAMKTYNKKEKEYTYNSNVVNLINDNQT